MKHQSKAVGVTGSLSSERVAELTTDGSSSAPTRKATKNPLELSHKVGGDEKIIAPTVPECKHIWKFGKGDWLCQKCKVSFDMAHAEIPECVHTWQIIAQPIFTQIGECGNNLVAVCTKCLYKKYV